MTDTANPLQKILAIHAQAQKMLLEHGLAQEGWTFVLSNTKNAMGRCSHADKEIEFSKWFIDSPQEQITDTLLHEIAHALVGPSKNPHGAIWKAEARRIGANPNRTYETTQVVNAAQHNYVMECPKCHHKWYRYRMRKRNIGGRCPTCKVEVEIYRIR